MKENNTKEEIVLNLYSCLKEATFEMCHSYSISDEYCKSFNENDISCSNNDGKCFVQRWMKALRQYRNLTEKENEQLKDK